MSARLPLALNLAVVAGQLSRPAVNRVLPSGDTLLSLELRTAGRDDRAETVPVVWPDPPAWAAALNVDDEILIVGRVRRRFYRAGGGTQSRTEIVADRITRTRDLRRVEILLATARRCLEGVTPPA